jgi:hypothetical protein
VGIAEFEDASKERMRKEVMWHRVIHGEVQHRECQGLDTLDARFTSANGFVEVRRGGNP